MITACKVVFGKWYTNLDIWAIIAVTLVLWDSQREISSSLCSARHHRIIFVHSVEIRHLVGLTFSVYPHWRLHRDPYRWLTKHGCLHSVKYPWPRTFLMRKCDITPRVPILTFAVKVRKKLSLVPVR